MKVIAGYRFEKRLSIKPSALTWGVFDGLHIGHQKLLRELVKTAQELGLCSVVLNFSQHPRQVLSEKEVPLLISIEERIHRFKEIGIDYCVLSDFSKSFSYTDATKFVRDIVYGLFNARAIAICSQSRFGRDIEGSVELLKTLCKELGIQLNIVEPEFYLEKPVSSTYIRQLIAQGMFSEVESMLGREYWFHATAIKGAGRGTQIGIPTTNCSLDTPLIPRTGVYTGHIAFNNYKFHSLINIGFRPTFESISTRPSVEVHIPDWQGQISPGSKIVIRFIQRIRDEKKFDSVEELKNQIEKDIATLKSIHG